MDTAIPFLIPELESMRKYPEKLYYRGDTSLLQRPKISIVGSRRPNLYTKALTMELARKLSMKGMVVVSGAAGGVDRIAHEGAGAEHTIAVLPCGIDLRYPSGNTQLIESIESKGLLLSPYEPGFGARGWSFVARNEIVVALGEALIVTEAAMGSGSMRSAEYAIAMGKPIYVLPHRLRESDGTQKLLAEGKAHAIEEIDAFVSKISGIVEEVQKDSPFIAFCRNAPTYEEVVERFPSEIFAGELAGTIEVRHGRVYVV